MAQLSRKIAVSMSVIHSLNYDYDYDYEIDLFGHIILRKYITMKCIIYKI